jgi:hypothetical protein
MGPIAGIIQSNANLFRTRVAGVDVDGRYAYASATYSWK